MAIKAVTIWCGLRGESEGQGRHEAKWLEVRRGCRAWSVVGGLASSLYSGWHGAASGEF